MRILVVSDSHGDGSVIDSAIALSGNTDMIVHCGDGAMEASLLRSRYPDKMVVSVCGNCDFGSVVPSVELFSVEGKKLFVTHGHLYNVKSGLYTLACAAREAGADIVLFGHTHIPFESYEDGLYMLNPGSIRGCDGTYGFVDITDKGIVTNIKSLYDR